MYIMREASKRGSGSPPSLFRLATLNAAAKPVKCILAGPFLMLQEGKKI